MAEGKKKGLGPIAWVLIGCLGVVVIGFGALAVGTLWLGKKVVETVNEPIKMAEVAVQMHPDFELVDSDAESGTLRIRRNGEPDVITVTIDDVIENGLVIESSSGERVEFNPSEGEGMVVTTTDAAGASGKVTIGEGGATVTGKDGVTAQFGGDIDRDDLPGWLPEFDGEVTPSMVGTQGNGEVGGMLSIKSTRSTADFRAAIEKKFEGAGFTRTGLVEQAGIVVLQYEQGERKVSVQIYPGDGGTQATATFNGPVD